MNKFSRLIALSLFLSSPSLAEEHEGTAVHHTDMADFNPFYDVERASMVLANHQEDLGLDAQKLAELQAMLRSHQFHLEGLRDTVVQATHLAAKNPTEENVAKVEEVKQQAKSAHDKARADLQAQMTAEQWDMFRGYFNATKPLHGAAGVREVIAHHRGELGLTDEQVSQLERILADYRVARGDLRREMEGLGPVHSNGDLSAEKMGEIDRLHQARKDLDAEMKADVAEVLTDEQEAKLDEMMRTHRANGHMDKAHHGHDHSQLSGAAMSGDDDGASDLGNADMRGDLRAIEANSAELGLTEDDMRMITSAAIQARPDLEKEYAELFPIVEAAQVEGAGADTLSRGRAAKNTLLQKHESVMDDVLSGLSKPKRKRVKRFWKARLLSRLIL